jgi:hypothetical protein
MNKFKSTEKDKAFEDLIKELQKLKGRGKEFNFGTSSKAKGSTEHTIDFNYQGYYCKVELFNK